VVAQPQQTQPIANTAMQAQQPQQPVMQQPTQMPAPGQAAMPVQNIALDQTQAAQPTPPSTDLNANANQAMQQLQVEYQQKLNDYSVQNKAILDQLQALASKVAAIENQMNQLTQNIARPNPLLGPSSNAAPTAAPAPAAAADDSAPRISYNVQAIIPGRAWLKSDNGETVTVAEGDVVRDLGRISKIDPYDGVVEINTGNKTVTLSYGNVG